jgi:hypothetical protein
MNVIFPAGLNNPSRVESAPHSVLQSPLQCPQVPRLTKLQSLYTKPDGESRGSYFQRQRLSIRQSRMRMDRLQTFVTLIRV